MNNRYIITAEAPLLQPGLTITTEASEKYVIAATRMLLTKVRGLNDDETEVEKLKVALHHTEMHLKQELGRNKPKGMTIYESAQPKPIRPRTTVRIKPKDMDPHMPLTERYDREVARRTRNQGDPPRPRGAP